MCPFRSADCSEIHHEGHGSTAADWPAALLCYPHVCHHRPGVLQRQAAQHLRSAAWHPGYGRKKKTKLTQAKSHPNDFKGYSNWRFEWIEEVSPHQQASQNVNHLKRLKCKQTAFLRSGIIKNECGLGGGCVHSPAGVCGCIACCVCGPLCVAAPLL